MKRLSIRARSLWGKKSRQGDLLWLPLVIHMADTADIAKKLWDRWLSTGVKNSISSEITCGEHAKDLFVFLAAVHDLGKSIPAFQAKRSVNYELDRWIETDLLHSGLPIKHISSFPLASKIHHALASQVLLENAGCDRKIAVILGAHHGKPPNNTTFINSSINTYPENYHLGDEGKEIWKAVQNELLDYALRLAGFPSLKEIPLPKMSAQVLLSGLVIMADWIASNEYYFPHIHVEDDIKKSMNTRSKFAWESLSLPYPWVANNSWMGKDFFRARFPFPPNEVQTAVQDLASTIHTPGILVLEAPMGVGKTEAALIAAEIFAAKTKRKGIFFALPSQATSDGIFPRMLEWVKNLESDEIHSIQLAHGKSEFNELYQGLKGNTNTDSNGFESEIKNDYVMVHQWFEGRKRALLDDFLVGTIDQLLLAALKQKHVMLRHLGLANKVVIIDECHAYDAYMSQYLERILNWLGLYQVPVIVLSATLPAKKRQEVVDAYLNKTPTSKTQSDPLGKGCNTLISPPKLKTNYDYPLVTATDGRDIKQVAIPISDTQIKVYLKFITEDEIIGKLEDLLSDGGCAGIIVNTVKKAQKLAKILSIHFGEETVHLLHSRFIAPDRAKKEERLLQELGKPSKDQQRPHRRILVGTQVLEQSLDIDFDLLISDICPIDLLLQRIGRLHRHKRKRRSKLKAPLCFITGVDGDSLDTDTERIYGKYLLMRTIACIPEEITLPKDISGLVQDVYNDKLDILPTSKDYSTAIASHKKRIESKVRRANTFRINRPWLINDLMGWLDTGASDKSGEAAVRDGDESIEVLVVQKCGKGYFRILPWIEGGRQLRWDEIPDWDSARALARCSVRLPNILCGPWIIDKTIKELEDLSREHLWEWQNSHRLSGQLFLILDENYSMVLGDYLLSYDKSLGLIHEKEGNKND